MYNSLLEEPLTPQNGWSSQIPNVLVKCVTIIFNTISTGKILKDKNLEK